MKKIAKVKDIIFDKNLFVNYLSGTVLDLLLCSYRGLPKGVNYMDASLSAAAMMS